MVGEREVSQSGSLNRAPVFSSAASPSPTPSLASTSTPAQQPGLAKRYQRTKRILALARGVLSSALALGIVWTGLSLRLEHLAHSVTQHPYGVLIGFLILFGVIEATVSFPLRFASGYVLEHRYRLSNQRFSAWLWESLKGSLVGTAIGLPIVLGLYASLEMAGPLWWIPVGGIVFVGSVVLARVAPTVIFPLFYRFEPIGDRPLKDRLKALGEQVGVDIDGVFVFNMSKTTKKANAAFTGMGRSKRIILGDTLLANFTDEEIETVFAHELGHLRMHHLWVMLLVGFVTTFVGLAACAWAYDGLLPWFNLPDRTSIAGLPLLGLLLSVYSLVTAPITNTLSRAHELAADRYAVRLTNRPDAFVRALKKLAQVNLAELQPPKVIEFLFHSHPSLGRRIQAIEGGFAQP